MDAELNLRDDRIFRRHTNTLTDHVDVDYRLHPEDGLVDFLVKGGPTFELSMTAAALTTVASALARAGTELHAQAAVGGPA